MSILFRFCYICVVGVSILWQNALSQSVQLVFPVAISVDSHHLLFHHAPEPQISTNLPVGRYHTCWRYGGTSHLRSPRCLVGDYPIILSLHARRTHRGIHILAETSARTCLGVGEWADRSWAFQLGLLCHDTHPSYDCSHTTLSLVSQFVPHLVDRFVTTVNSCVHTICTLYQDEIQRMLYGRDYPHRTASPPQEREQQPDIFQ